MIHGKFSHLLVAAALAALALPAAAQTAQNPTSLGVSGDWESFTYESEGAKVCYATSAPKKSEASKKGVARDPVYFMITHWPSKKVRSQPSVMIGYKFQGSLGRKAYCGWPHLCALSRRQHGLD